MPNVEIKRGIKLHLINMKIQIESSKLIKPCYQLGTNPIQSHTPLSVFDQFTYVTHLAFIYAYKPPTPSNELLELGLQKVLVIYPEWAGRLGVTVNGVYSILQNDEGVRFIEASGDGELDEIMPLEPSKVSVLGLHPDTKGVDELLQVQLTRFACGSLVVGVTAHHHVCDGQARTKFLVAWGQACRGLAISPLPLRDRTIFSPQNPPCVEFQHRGVEFISMKQNHPPAVDEVVMHKTHFTVDFLSILKAKASSKSMKVRTTFESLLAHLWRSITLARQLDRDTTTHVRISINGRSRLVPKLPDEYFGNVILWAFPTTKVNDLLDEPLSYAANLIHDAITKIDDSYFKSFIDFANNEVKNEGLVSTADTNKKVLSPNVDVDSWLRFPFYDVDFGGGSPFIFMPSYRAPVEGLIFLAPTLLRDGSVDAFVSLYHKNLDAFKGICYSME